MRSFSASTFGLWNFPKIRKHVQARVSSEEKTVNAMYAIYELNRLCYRLFRVALRILLGSRTSRDKWISRLWIGAFDLPTFLPQKARRAYRRKCAETLIPRFFYETAVLNYMKQIRGELYVDVGASLGTYVKELAPNFRRVIAIEADPEICTILRERAPSNCEVLNVAVGNKVRLASFYTPQGGKLSQGSLLPANQRHFGNHAATETMFKVHMTTLDHVLAQEPEIDLVKVDVEGTEKLVLRGANRIEKKVKRWLIEIHDPEDIPRVVELMHRYRARKLDSNHYAFE
jgi:FkbM family methyltransferase